MFNYDPINLLAGTGGLQIYNGGSTALVTVNPNGLLDATFGGLATRVKAGIISDSDFADTPVDGLLALDSSDNRLYVRTNGTWRYVGLTAGFQIPNNEAYSYNFDTKTFDTSQPLAVGDFLLPFAESQMSDGAIHGLYTKFSDVKGLLFASEDAQIASLSAQISNLQAATQSAILTTLLAKGAATFEAQTEFQGPAIFRTIAEYFDTVIFHKDVNVLGRATFNSDTAGFAVIPTGARQVDITFDSEYAAPPVVTTTPLWDTDQSTLGVMKELGMYILPEQNYIIADVTTKGFTIILEEAAVTDLKFSWAATSISGAKTFVGTVPTPTPTASPEASPSAVPSPTP
jgi:hypothetical protein